MTQTLSVISVKDFNQNRMAETTNWRSWYLNNDGGRQIQSLQAFHLQGKTYVSCAQSDARARCVTWLASNGSGRHAHFVEGWCLLDGDRKAVEMSGTFAKYIGGGALFGRPAGGFTYWREMTTEEPTAADWIAAIDATIAECEPRIVWAGEDYRKEVIAPRKAARAQLQAST